jgi:hypothetical protein
MRKILTAVAIAIGLLLIAGTAYLACTSARAFHRINRILRRRILGRC